MMPQIELGVNYLCNPAELQANCTILYCTSNELCGITQEPEAGLAMGR